MADQPSGRLARIALALAIAAVAIVGAAVIMMIVRAPDRSVREGAAGARDVGRGSDLHATAAGAPAVVVVDARNVVRLRDRSVVEAQTNPASPVGMRVIDATVRAGLQLEADDVITTMSGKPVRSVGDIAKVMAAGRAMDITSMYIELIRGGSTLVLEWELAGQLSDALDPITRRPLAFTSPTDPLLTTITRHSATAFSLPRSTFERIASDVLSASGNGWSAGVRPVPSPSGGVRLFAIRPGTVWTALGFQSGDTIQRANGADVVMSTLRDVFDQQRGADSIELEILRYGAPLRLHYSIQ